MENVRKKKPQVAEGFQKDNILNRSQKRLIFYVLMMALPVIQFCIFYIYVNINTVRLAFIEFKPNTVTGIGYISSWNAAENFKDAWSFFTTNIGMVKNSAILFLCQTGIVMTLALVFSYYICKNYMLSGFFRATLYLPHIISQVVLVLLYKYMLTDVYMELCEIFTGEKAPYGLLDLPGESGANIKFWVIVIYNLWIGFGSNVLIFTGTMSGIDGSIIESAQLDGVNIIQEFIHIYIPMIFPTFTTFLVTGMCGLLTADMHLFTFYGESGAGTLDTFGYFMYRNTLKRSNMYEPAGPGSLSYPVQSALGVIMTCIMVPLTLIVRKLLETYGPRTD